MIAAIYARRSTDLNVYALTTRRQREQLAEYRKQEEQLMTTGPENPVGGSRHPFGPTTH